LGDIYNFRSNTDFTLAMKLKREGVSESQGTSESSVEEEQLRICNKPVLK
jgi:hypothetical protein